MRRDDIEALEPTIRKGWPPHEVTHLVDALVSTAKDGTADDRSRVLKVLMGHGRHAEAARFADACPPDEWAVIKHGSQAQVELGALTGALERLSRVEPVDARQRDELAGRRGRIYKQLYLAARPTVHEPRLHDLERALGYYGTPFDRSPASLRWSDPDAPYWLGVNVLALLHHAAALAVHEPSRQAELVARRDALWPAVHRAATAARTDHPDDPWPLLTLAETCLVDPSRHDEAESHVVAALDLVRTHAPTLSMFALESFERQLTELWGLRADDALGRRVLLPVREMKARTPGAWALQGGQELVLGRDAALRYDVLARLFQRARGVARIEQRLGLGAIGTAFAVARDLVITCRHVAGAARPGSLVATFTQNLDETGRPRQLLVARVVWDSVEHDACLLELATPLPSADDALPLAVDDLDPAIMRRVYALGHPGGADLHVSLHDSELVAFDDRTIHYRTPTMAGSSGGAMLDEGWRVVGVHARGGTTLRTALGAEVVANECIRVDRLWPAIAPHVRRSWEALGAPGDLDHRPRGVAAPPPSRPTITPIPTPHSPRPALWVGMEADEALPHAIARCLRDESIQPAIVHEARSFELSLDLQGPTLYYRLGNEEQALRSFNDTIINHTSRPGALAGEAPYFFLVIEGTARGGGDPLVLAGEYRQDGATYRFGPGVPGVSLLVAIPSTMSDQAPVQVFTFDVKATTPDGHVHCYDPLCVNVPVAGSVVQPPPPPPSTP